MLGLGRFVAAASPHTTAGLPRRRRRRRRPLRSATVGLQASGFDEVAFVGFPGTPRRRRSFFEKRTGVLGCVLGGQSVDAGSDLKA